ncbi:helix-turn-helix domain-containing protein [Endozoicomonadaceae bacterium StTr2]
MNKHTQPGLVSFDASSVNCRRQLILPQGIRLAEYQNGNERLYYQNEQSHTFSLYLQGGFQTVRTDERSRNGAPGHFCLMPEGAYSAWDVGPTQRFFHLYFDDHYLRRLALATFDLDPRLINLPELTFSHDPALEALARHSIAGWDWQGTDCELALEQAVQLLLVNLLKQQGLVRHDPDRLKGGLAPAINKRVCDYIQAHLHRPISLSELAAVAELSEYHFCRMFKTSLAETPQQYITRLRVERVQTLLQQQLSTAETRQSMADIALVCGFSSQSHMGRAFKKQTGITPGHYLRSLAR